MNWLRENWFWIVVFGLFMWVHLKMHGGHGHHGAGGPHLHRSGRTVNNGQDPEGLDEPTTRHSRRTEDDHAGH